MISVDILEKIIKEHNLWLETEGKKGKRAVLSDMDLSYANLRGVNLSRAFLKNTNFFHADLRNANFSNAYFTLADLRFSNAEKADFSSATFYMADASNADFKEANLSSSDLQYSKFYNANLTSANLKEANLVRAALEYAILSNADLTNADLRNSKLDKAVLDNIKCDGTLGLNILCPKEGNFIGYKKALSKDNQEVIVELKIPADALRVNGTSSVCRCDKALVLSISSLKGNESYDRAYSIFDNSFVYQVGKMVETKDFDLNRWNDYSSGIRFFLTRNEAVKYYNPFPLPTI